MGNGARHVPSRAWHLTARARHVVQLAVCTEASLSRRCGDRGPVKLLDLILLERKAQPLPPEHRVCQISPYIEVEERPLCARACMSGGTRPLPTACVIDQAGIDGIPLDVAKCIDRMPRAHCLREVSPLPVRSSSPDSPVEVLGELPMRASDALRQRVLRTRDRNDVNMVRHKAESCDSRRSQPAESMEQRQVVAPINIVVEQLSLVIASVCDMVWNTNLRMPSRSSHLQLPFPVLRVARGCYPRENIPYETPLTTMEQQGFRTAARLHAVSDCLRKSGVFSGEFGCLTRAVWCLAPPGTCQAPSPPGGAAAAATAPLTRATHRTAPSCLRSTSRASRVRARRRRA